MIIRLRFKPEATLETMQEVEDTGSLAFIAAGILHGDAAVRLAAGYAISHEKRTLVLRYEGEAGDTTARLLVGLCMAEFGQTSFTIERVDDKDRKASAPPWDLEADAHQPGGGGAD